MITLVEQGSAAEADLSRWSREEDDLKAVLAASEGQSVPAAAAPRETPRFVVDSTGAVLTFGSATSLLYTTCALLPRDGDQSTAPAFTFSPSPDGFTAQLVLPKIEQLGDAPRTIESAASWPSQQLAKQDAAFVACRLLHSVGVLDDRLLPVRADALDPADGYLDADGNESRYVAPSKAPIPCAQTSVWGPAWSEDAPLWLHRVVVALDGGQERSIGLVAARRLDMDGPFELAGDGAGSATWSVRIEGVEQLVWADADERRVLVEQLDAFSRCVVDDADRADGSAMSSGPPSTLRCRTIPSSHDWRQSIRSPAS